MNWRLEAKFGEVRALFGRIAFIIYKKSSIFQRQVDLAFARSRGVRIKAGK